MSCSCDQRRQEWALQLYSGDRQAFFWRLGGVFGWVPDFR